MDVGYEEFLFFVAVTRELVTKKQGIDRHNEVKAQNGP